MESLRMHWKNELGWVIDTPKGMTPMELQRAIDYTLKVQTDRWLSLPPGDRKDECFRTIQALKSGRVHVNIAGTGERVLFDAYKQQKHYWSFA